MDRDNGYRRFLAYRDVLDNPFAADIGSDDGEEMSPLLQTMFAQELDRQAIINKQVWSYDRSQSSLKLWEWPCHMSGAFIGQRIAPSGIEIQSTRQDFRLPVCFCTANKDLAIDDCRVQVFSHIYPGTWIKVFFFRCKGFTNRKPFSCLYSVRLFGNQELLGGRPLPASVGDVPLQRRTLTTFSRPSSPTLFPLYEAFWPQNCTTIEPAQAQSGSAIPVRPRLAQTPDALQSRAPAGASSKATVRGSKRPGKARMPRALDPYFPRADNPEPLTTSYLGAYNSIVGVPTNAFFAFATLDRYCADCSHHFAGDDNHDNHLILGNCNGRHESDGESSNSSSADDDKADAKVVELSVRPTGFGEQPANAI
ncbi:hypothetical protein BD410DRAFT_842243 [Rickenella mellea]|uniref:Uncharacterized protein n=1 Tax=Rickenella mellea TaxID=50990 RepID=A0A4Y7PVT1_9AGAM|nr:hypothetical protein BD410DRAFT_842243 [Rickenella mellea]